ncbi:MAG: M20/M25/M40 family metallo-hydrolase [Rikenellaceae bacterium]
MQALELLKKLISTPSHSREEGATASIIEGWLSNKGVAQSDIKRLNNNILAYSKGFFAEENSTKQILLLNSHHDTVKPAASYTRDPYSPDVEDGKLYGLGSNDAGASVVGLMSAFVAHYPTSEALPFRIILAITAEEEVMGENGIRSLIDTELKGVAMAIVGEPTLLDGAVGERGLVVLDCVAEGKSGHAARDEGENALYKAVRDIEKLRTFQFEKESELLGPIRMTTTMIECGTQHNVVPDRCKFVVDCRTTDAYSNVDFAKLIDSVLESSATPRSTRINASALDKNHPLLQCAEALGAKAYISPTTSDMALMPWPALKIGAGDSARSHTADEYVGVDEVERGVAFYTEMIKKLSEIL